jgi:hypothetical protein
MNRVSLRGNVRRGQAPRSTDRSCIFSFGSAAPRVCFSGDPQPTGAEGLPDEEVFQISFVTESGFFVLIGASCIPALIE